MKAVIKIFILSIILSSITWIAPQKASAQISVSVDFQVFYDDLSPYGSWIDNSDYGYVWLPDVSSDFTPYGTNGYWVYTYDGWTWVSNYSWGWAPFHYGRWHYDSYYGWLWVPDTEWGPGWVTWRRSEGYYGWAPIGPGISIDFAYSSGYNLPYNQWTFVRDRDFGRTNIYNYYVSSSNYTTIINNSTVINNIYTGSASNVRYNTGPERNEVERYVGKTISPIIIQESNRHGQNLSGDQLQMYRPHVQKNISSDRKPAPSRVVDMKDVKPAGQRNTEPSRQRVEPTRQPQNDNPARRIEPSRQPPQRDNQPKRVEPTQQPQKDNSPKRVEPTRQPPQRDNPPKKEEPTRQPQKDNPPKKVEPVRQPPQRDNPPKREEPTRQPKKDNPPKKEEPAKQSQKDNPHKKGKE